MESIAFPCSDGAKSPATVTQTTASIKKIKSLVSFWKYLNIRINVAFTFSACSTLCPIPRLGPPPGLPRKFTVGLFAPTFFVSALKRSPCPSGLFLNPSGRLCKSDIINFLLPSIVICKYLDKYLKSSSIHRVYQLQKCCRYLIP